MAEKKNLSELATKYGTDKRPQDHNYTPMYERMLGTIEVNSLLEIGLGNGASLRMWLDYYRGKDIYCIELFGDENKNLWEESDGIITGLNLIPGDSTLAETWEIVPNNLDAIVDDGEHHPDIQIATFMQGFSHLRKGGLYFIEDLHCNFTELYTGGHDIFFPWLFDLIINQETPSLNYGGNFYLATRSMSELARQIYSYHIYKSVVIFEKA